MPRWGHFQDVDVTLEFYVVRDIRAGCKDWVFFHHFFGFRSDEGGYAGLGPGLRFFLNVTVFDNKSVFRTWTHGGLGGG